MSVLVKKQGSVKLTGIRGPVALLGEMNEVEARSPRLGVVGVLEIVDISLVCMNTTIPSGRGE